LAAETGPVAPRLPDSVMADLSKAVEAQLPAVVRSQLSKVVESKVPQIAEMVMDLSEPPTKSSPQDEDDIQVQTLEHVNVTVKAENESPKINNFNFLYRPSVSDLKNLPKESSDTSAVSPGLKTQVSAQNLQMFQPYGGYRRPIYRRPIYRRPIYRRPIYRPYGYGYPPMYRRPMYRRRVIVRRYQYPPWAQQTEQASTETDKASQNLQMIQRPMYRRQVYRRPIYRRYPRVYYPPRRRVVVRRYWYPPLAETLAAEPKASTDIDISKLKDLEVAAK